MTRTDCTIILGMHRSGTSALTGCLSLMGLNLGNALMPGNQANQSGYFENQDIVLAHDILFRDLGCRWDMVGSLPSGWTESQAADKAVQTLTGIIKTQFLGQNKSFAVKDPRLCRLMPLWTRVLNQLEIHPSVIFMLRHPMEVAKSLHKRDGFDLLKGHLLWLVHNREALAACRELDHTVLTYDQLLADPISTLKEVSTLPALSGIDPLRQVQTILAQIRPELKNEHQSQAQESKDGLFQHYAWIYDHFRSLQAQTRLARLEQAQDKKSSSIFQSDLTSQFPLAISDTRIIPAQDERRQAAEVLDNLLQMIMSYEQAELNLAIQRQRRILATTNVAETIFAQIFFPDSKKNEYREERSQKILLAPEEWQQVLVDISDPLALRTKGLRLDPLNTRGVAIISAIKLINAVSGDVCWSVQEDFTACAVQGDALVLPADAGLEILATGNDPRVILPEVPDLPDVPMQLECWIKAGRRQELLHIYWQDLVQREKQLTTEMDELKEDRERIKAELDKLHKQLADKEQALQAELAEWQSKEKEQRQSLQQEQAENKRLQGQIQELEKSLEHTDQARDQAQQELERHKALAEEYSTSVTQAEQEQQRLQATVSERDEQLADLRSRLETKEELIQEYFQALSEADAEQDALHSQLQKLEEKNKQLAAQQEEMEEQKNSFEDQTSALQEQIKNKDDVLQRMESDHRKQVQNKDCDIKKLEDRLHRQEDLTRQYFHALADAESEQQQLRMQLMDLEEETKQQQTWLRQLHKDVQALVHSMRWKVGNFLVRILECLLLRGRKPTAVDHMQDVVHRFAQRGHKTKNRSKKLSISHGLQPPFAGDRKELLTWMRQLENDFRSLQHSMRWKMGNGLVRGVEILLFRRRPALAVDHMLDIFAQYREWKDQTQAEEHPYFLSYQDEKKLEDWLRKLNKDVQALKESRRWKVGNAVIRGVECVLLRKKEPLAIEHMQKILEQVQK